MFLLRAAASHVDPSTTCAPSFSLIPNELLFEMFAIAWSGPPLEHYLQQADRTALCVGPFLSRAIQCDDLDLVKTLLRLGSSPLEDRVQGGSALELAISRGNHAIVATLLNTTATFDSLRKVLRTAVERGDIDATRLLLERGAKTKDMFDSERLIIAAAASGNMPLLNIVISHVSGNGHLQLLNARVNSRLYNAPLATAASKGHDEMVRALIDLEADLNFNSAIAQAVINDRLSTIRSLAILGANVNQNIENRGSLLHIAAESCSSETIRLLIDLGADKNVVVRNNASSARSRENHFGV